MTRVLFLTESFHPVLGGGESHIRMLASRLAASGVPSLVLTRRADQAWSRDELLDGVRVLRVPPSGPGRTGKYAMLPRVVGALVRRRQAYDLIVVRGGRVLALPALLTARLLGKRVVLQPEVTGEMSGEIYTWGTRLHRPWVRALVGAVARFRNRWLRDADACVGISSLVRQELLASGVEPDRVAEIPHGVDTNRFRPASSEERAALRIRLGIGGSGPIVVFTGRLLRGKGVEVLLEAFARLCGRHDEAHLVLVGSGAGQSLSVEDQLRATASPPPLAGRVTFAGRVENVEDYLRAADVFAFPSYFEAMPLSVLEAASCGLPCVASSVGGILDVLDEGSGRLVPPGDVGRLAVALDRLLGDAGQRAALGAAARATVLSRFDLDASVDRYRALFTELAARSLG